MESTGFFEHFQLFALAALGVLGIGRAIVLYARGVRVLVIDPGRTPRQAAADLVALILFLSWAYEAIAYARPLRAHLMPACLSAILVDGALVKGMGVMIELVGLSIFALALWSFADSWRIGIDRQRAGALVTGGIFAWTRNPIYIAFDLLVFGSFLILGRALFLVLALALLASFHSVILREERHLGAVYGDAYRQYCARVGRYLSWH